MVKGRTWKRLLPGTRAMEWTRRRDENRQMAHMNTTATSGVTHPASCTTTGIDTIAALAHVHTYTHSHHVSTTRHDTTRHGWKERRKRRERTGTGDGVDEETHTAKGADLLVVVQLGVAARRARAPEGPPGPAPVGDQERAALALAVAVVRRRDLVTCVGGFLTTTSRTFYVSVVVDRHDEPRKEKSPVLGWRRVGRVKAK